MIDLIDFGGTYISLTSIHAVIDEMVEDRHTGVVFIDYGHGSRAQFEGTAREVMRIIETWQKDAFARDSSMASAVPRAA